MNLLPPDIGGSYQAIPPSHESASSSAPSRFVCPESERSYNAAETLIRHQKSHSRNVDYICKVCEAGFRRKDLLDRSHGRFHQSSSEEFSSLR